MGFSIKFAALVALSAIFGTSEAPAQDRYIDVSAAVSMRSALDDINAAYTKSTGVKVIAAYAASSTLIRQIIQGAVADVFASADVDWMDFGSKRKLIQDGTRFNLLANRLVLIAPKDSKLDSVEIGPNFDLAKLAGDDSIATGDVREVPVGKYAKAALENLGAWRAAAPKFIMTPHDRRTVTLVARGDASLGIVYASDAKVSPRVKVIGIFPANSHPPIIYPLAATVTAKPDAVGYLAHLRSTAAKLIFEREGFAFLVRPTP